MERQIKKCKECGKENTINQKVCGCGAPLFMIIPEYQDVSKYDLNSDSVNNEREVRKFRRCNVCGTINYILEGKGIRTCINPECTNDELYRSRIEIEPKAKKTNKTEKETIRNIETCRKKVFLQGVEKKIEISRDLILGRMGDVETAYFEKYQAVSRQHCKLYSEDGVWYVKQLSKTNGTYVNGRKLEDGEIVRLEDEDILTIWRLNFEVQMESEDVFRENSISN